LLVEKIRLDIIINGKWLNKNESDFIYRDGELRGR
jgi:hypothetical protein